MNANIFEKANQIIKSCDVVYISVLDENGYPHVSTVSSIQPENILEAYFVTGIGSNKSKCLQRDKRASVCCHVDGNNITLIGEAEVHTDQETKSRLWRDEFTTHFPHGETDPNYCVIKFTTKRASLWLWGDRSDKHPESFTIKELLTVQSRCGLLCDGCAQKKSEGCAGCIALKGRPFWGECPVAICCQSKNHTHCGECADMPCEMLNDFSCGDGEHCDAPKGARIAVCRAWAGSR